jgi:hypothetical protein
MAGTNPWRFPVISLIKLSLRFTWLALFVLGVRRAWEIFQGGADQFIDRLEEGESGPPERTLARLHEALHHRQSQHAAGDDPFGEM